MSDAIKTLSGYPAADFIGDRVRSYAGLIHPDDAALVRQATGEAAANKRPYAIDCRIFHQEGSGRSPARSRGRMCA